MEIVHIFVCGVLQDQFHCGLFAGNRLQKVFENLSFWIRGLAVG